MPGYLKQATASQSRALGPFVDDTDFKTVKTGLTIANTDIKLIVNGGASANKNSGGGTHRANGVYGVTFDATDTATVGEMEVSVVVAGALVVFDKFFVLEEAVYDALFAASAPGYLQPATAGRTLVVDAAGLTDANVVKVGPSGSGIAQTARDVGASVLLSAGTGTGQLDFTSGVVKANAVQWLGGTIPAVNVTGVPLVDLKYTLGTISPATAGSVRADAVTGAVGSVTGAVGSVTGAVGSVTGNVGGNVTGSVGSVVGAVGSVTGLTASDVGVIKAVTDKLDDTLEDDAGTYRFTTNALEQAPSGGGSLTVQDIVDGVLDEMIASHQDAGSVGEAISDAGAAGNPWNAVVEGSLTGGDLLRAAAAVNAGNLTAVRNANGSITFTYRDVSNASDIVAGTADRNGNRTVVVTP